MTREEQSNLLNELLEYEEKNDIGNLTRAERGEFQQWVKALEQEPRKGHWIVEKGGSYLGQRNDCCSNCKDFYTNDWNVMNYCPNCGADMREVEE